MRLLAAFMLTVALGAVGCTSGDEDPLAGAGVQPGPKRSAPPSATPPPTIVGGILLGGATPSATTSANP